MMKMDREPMGNVLHNLLLDAKEAMPAAAPG